MNIKPHQVYCRKKAIGWDFEIGENYEVLDKIGQGGYGEIFKLYDSKSNKLFAVKFEKQADESKRLQHESSILLKLQGNQGIPKLILYGEKPLYNFIVMQYLGYSLENLIMIHKQFSLKTVLQIGLQMLEILEGVHNLGILHRDIKPENILIGPDGQQHKLYLADYGLSRIWLQQDGSHIPEVKRQFLLGTVKFASMNSHKELELSRRDDLESLGYVLAYLFKGSLPWQHMKLFDKQQIYEVIKQKKEFTALVQVAKGSQELVMYLHYVRGLQFDEQPNYNYLKQLLMSKLSNLKTNDPGQCYEWCQKPCDQAKVKEYLVKPAITMKNDDNIYGKLLAKAESLRKKKNERD